MAWQDAEARLVDLVMAGWRHGTKRGQGPRLFIVLLVYWHYLYTLSSISITNIYLLAILAFQLYYKFLVVSSPTSLPSPARRFGTARGEWYYQCPHSGRLTSWYETGSGAPLVDSIIVCEADLYVLMLYVR